jgi:hypothetical protein
MPMRIAPKRRQGPAVNVAEQVAAMEADRAHYAEVERHAQESARAQALSLIPKDPMTQMLERLTALEGRNAALEVRVAHLERTPS